MNRNHILLALIGLLLLGSVTADEDYREIIDRVCNHPRYQKNFHEMTLREKLLLRLNQLQKTLDRLHRQQSKSSQPTRHSKLSGTKPSGTGKKQSDTSQTASGGQHKPGGEKQALTDTKKGNANQPPGRQSLSIEIEKTEKEIVDIRRRLAEIDGRNIDRRPLDNRLPDKRQRSSQPRRSRSIDFSSTGGDSSAFFWSFFVYVFAAVILVALIVYIAAIISKHRALPPVEAAIKTAPSNNNATPVASTAAEDPEMLCQQQHYLDACRAVCHNMLANLRSRRLLPNKTFLTNYELLLLISDDQLRENLQVATDTIERGYYACRPITEEDYRQCHQSWMQMRSYLSMGRKSSRS